MNDNNLNQGCRKWQEIEHNTEPEWVMGHLRPINSPDFQVGWQICGFINLNITNTTTGPI